MKKTFLLGVALMLILGTNNCFGANEMETDSWNVTVISMANADVEPPFVTDHFPAKNSVGASINHKPSCHVKDLLTGVDISSIIFSADGVPMAITILGDKNDYFVEGNPGIFAWDKVVVYTIDAVDLSNN